MYKLHFRKILPLPKVLPPPLEIGFRTPMYTGFITNVNCRSNNVNQHAVNTLESMKDEDEYSNCIANKTTNKRFLCRLDKYTNLDQHHSEVNSTLFKSRVLNSLNGGGGGFTRPIPRDGGADQFRGIPIVGRLPTDGSRREGCGRKWLDAEGLV